MKYDTVIFDLDGTLLNTLDDLTDSVNAVLQRRGYPPRTAQEIRRFLGYGARYLIRSAMPQGCTEDEVNALLEEYVPYYAAHCQIKTCVYDGLLDAMDALLQRGVRLGVVSNKPDAATKILCREHFGRRLSVAVGDLPPRRCKPAPDAVLAAMEEIGADAAHTVYVGDSEVDVQTAHNAGVACIAVCWGFRDRPELERAGADTIAAAAPELLRHILG